MKSMKSVYDYVLPAQIRESFYQQGYWREDDFWTSAERVADRVPDSTAFIEGDRSLTFGQISAQARRVGHALRARGIESGDVVIIHGRHCLEATVTILGCAWAGVVPALLPQMFSVEQIAAIVDNTRSRMMFGFGESAELERTQSVARQSGLELVVADNDGDCGATAWSHFLVNAEAESVSRTPVSADALALLIFSSGTTGMPKGVMHSANTIRYSIEAYAGMQGICEADTSLVVTAFGFVGSSVLGFFLSYLVGCKTVLLCSWSADATLELIEQHSVTHLLLMPTHAIDILGSPKLDATDCSSVSRGVVAGVNEQYRMDARQRLCAKPFPMYGMSESPAHVTGSIADDWDDLRTSEGRWLPGTEVKICDDEDQPLPDGEQGNILVRGPNRFLGYYRAPDLCAASLNADGYFRTGDIGVIDQRGCMHFVSRSKDIIRRGGVTITPSDIESALRPHPRLSDVSVIGLPDDRLGERACACVITRDGAPVELKVLTDFLEKNGLARYLWPEYVELCTEFPRTPSLKVQKNALRKEVLERRESRV